MNEEEAIEYIEQFIGIKKEYKCKPIKVKTLNNTRVAIEAVLNLLEKKDKIIDEMAKKLSKFDYSQYCEVTNCDYPPCNKEKCIKQYFERKVENGN